MRHHMSRLEMGPQDCSRQQYEVRHRMYLYLHRTRNLFLDLQPGYAHSQTLDNSMSQ